jgi:predicted HNH restriction endonuclease
VGGYELWEKCLELGVAAITYEPFIYSDLSKQPPFETRNDWEKLAPAQKASLKRFVYEFEKGDIIFVKNGKYIVGRGKISGSYKFVRNSLIACPKHNTPWCHQIPVSWEKEFIPIKLLLGAEQFTVKPLDISQVKLILKEEKRAQEINNNLEVSEGDKYKAEVTFRKRNRAIIEAKKLNSNGNCEACGFNYSNFYNGLTNNHLVAHHLYPIALQEKVRITKLEDIVLVCSNCHTAIHSQNPPMGIKDLRNKIKNKW